VLLISGVYIFFWYVFLLCFVVLGEGELEHPYQLLMFVGIPKGLRDLLRFVFIFVPFECVVYNTSCVYYLNW
jgi:hypothetical protein